MLESCRVVSLIISLAVAGLAGCDCGHGGGDDDGPPHDAGGSDASPEGGTVDDAGADAQVDAGDGGWARDASVDAGIGDAGDDAGDAASHDDAGATDDAGGPNDAGPQDDAGADASVDLDCMSCHGSGDQPAPPADTAGRVDPALPTVGAHRKHLRGGVFFRTGQCTDCHVVPAAIDEPGHIDDSPAELVWGSVATADEVVPEYADDSCTVYCHGETLTGGEITRPDWTPDGPDQVYCGSCHGAPPPLPHLQVQTCGGCHPFDHLMPLDPERHVDGVLDVTLECTTCHGGPDGPAPPLDTHGNELTSATGVGAHASHLGPSDWRAPVVCTDCHRVPAEVGDAEHIDGDDTAELLWGDLARTDSANPSWDGETCSGVYCHGETLSGGTQTTPAWTTVDGTQDACGTCHGLPPDTNHPDSPRCADCHGMVIDAGGNFVAPERHVDGVVDLDPNASCGACHDLPPPTGTHAVHAALAEPEYGALTTGEDLGVTDGYAFGCGHCHPIDPARHMNGGRAEIQLHDPNAPAGSLKALNPVTATYVAGGAVLTDDFGLEYTLGTCSEVFCHSGISTTSSDVGEPGIDFPFIGYPITYPPYTVTRERTYADATWGGALSCGGCHEYPPRGEWPDDVAGAGESHATLAAEGWEDLHIWNHGYDPVPCRTCHFDTVTEVAPFVRDGNGVTTLFDVGIARHDRHVDGDVEVRFDTVDPFSYSQPVDLGPAAYDPATRTCSNVACHLDQTSVVFGTPYRSTNAVECNACHQY